MKKAILLGILMCLSSSAWAQSSPLGYSMSLSNWAPEQLSEASASVVYFFPSQQYSGFYDEMIGVEFSYTSWFAMPFGVSVMGGVMNADVRKDNRQLVDPTVGTFTGSATLVPIGFSVLYDIAEIEDWRVYGEAGLRYLFMSSDIQIRSQETGAKEDIGQDNAVVSLLRVNVDRKMSDEWSMFLSWGVQFDMISGDITSSAGKLGDDNMKGYSLSLGARYLF